MTTIPEPLLMILAKRFAAMGHPTRLRILHCVLHQEEVSISDLVELLEMAQPTVSKHVSTLIEAGLLGRQRIGNRVILKILDPNLAKICELCCGQVQEEIAALGEAIQGDG